MDSIAPPRTTAGRPALEGHLTDLEPADLLRLLGTTRQTGTLQVLSDGPVLLTFVDGAVSYATDDPNRTLRDVLMDEGILDEPTWDRAAAAGDDVQLGDALVEAGLDPDDVARVVRSLVLDVVTDLSLEPHGRFRFVPGRRHSLGDRFHYPIAQLGRDLGARLDEWAGLRDDVPSFTGRATLVPMLPAGRANISIGTADWRVMVAVTSAPSLDAARADLGMTRFVLARSIASLVRGGAVTIIPSSP